MIGEMSKYEVNGVKESQHTACQTTISRKQAQNMRVKTIQCRQVKFVGLEDFLFTFGDDSTLQGGARAMNKTVHLNKLIKRIVTKITDQEDLLYSIKFVFVDGSS